MKLLLVISMLVSMNIFSDLSNAVIIDVRSESEWNEGHLSKAYRVDWDEIAGSIEEIVPDKNVQIILYCRSGNRAGKSMKILTNLGYTNLINAGGLQSAKELSNDKVIKEEI